MDKWARKRATILKKYGARSWAWNWMSNGDLVVRSKTTGLMKNLGKIEP